jgi:uncharacterized RDD family membrane protein YckC
MDRKTKRTVISIEQSQPGLDFDEAEHSQPFTFPEYQRNLIPARLVAGIADFSIVAVIYLLFILATYLEMPEGLAVDKRIAGIYAAGFFVLATIYFFLFMISASQTPGMKQRQLTVVSQDGSPLDPVSACMRGFGYLVSILPLMLGFLWAVIDPEHLTWADKVSGTYIKKI